MSFETDYDDLVAFIDAKLESCNKACERYDRACEMAKQYGVYDAFRSLSPFYSVPVEILDCKNEEEVRALLSEYECMDANCE